MTDHTTDRTTDHTTDHTKNLLLALLMAALGLAGYFLKREIDLVDELQDRVRTIERDYRREWREEDERLRVAYALTDQALAERIDRLDHWAKNVHAGLVGEGDSGSTGLLRLVWELWEDRATGEPRVGADAEQRWNDGVKFTNIVAKAWGPKPD